MNDPISSPMMSPIWTIILAISVVLLPEATSAQEPVKTLHVVPAAEPDPALRYVFWPAPEQRIQGNAAPFITRAIMLRAEAEATAQMRQESTDRYNEWLEMPLSELPIEQVNDFLDRHAKAAFHELERAETLMGIDYDLRLRDLSSSEMVATVLPELQSMRDMARVLWLRGRVAIAEQRWEDLARDIRIGMRMGNVAGYSNDLLISRLVGYAITSQMMSLVREAIQQPNCPSFYWALAALPDSLYDIRNAFEFESILLAKLTTSFPPLGDKPIGAERARELIRSLASEGGAMFAGAGLASIDSQKRDLFVGIAVVSLAEPSRELLDKTSTWAGRANNLSSAEAVLRATLLRLERSRHNWLKWAMMPDYLWADYASRAEADLGLTPDDPDLFFVALANQLVPAVLAAKRAELRTKQERNLLITIEAIRRHAFETKTLPLSLDALEPVPAWHDPFSNQPFSYQRISETKASISHSPRQPGDEDVTLEIQLNSLPANEEAAK